MCVGRLKNASDYKLVSALYLLVRSNSDFFSTDEDEQEQLYNGFVLVNGTVLAACYVFEANNLVCRCVCTGLETTTI